MFQFQRVFVNHGGTRARVKQHVTEKERGREKEARANETPGERKGRRRTSVQLGSLPPQKLTITTIENARAHAHSVKLRSTKASCVPARRRRRRKKKCCQKTRLLKLSSCLPLAFPLPEWRRLYGGGGHLTFLTPD